MNLLTESWIPVRTDNGTGEFKLLSYKELLCNISDGEDLRVSLPRDDLELACLQLLVCLTQVIFLPKDDRELRQRLNGPVQQHEFSEKTTHYREWFDVSHDKYPFMQIRGLRATQATPIQKLLIGMPEGNNHAFFNDIGEVCHISPGCAAIVLFNQASNCPSFGGGFKGSLRGGAPITTLVSGETLRETIWRNVVTLPFIQQRLPDYEPGTKMDKPTWVEPIIKNEAMHATKIGLLRGLFWQPAHIELIPADSDGLCDISGQSCPIVYDKFYCDKFPYSMQGVWPHPHGVRIAAKKKGKMEFKFASFTTTAPAWTQLSEFVIPGRDPATGEGTTPAAPVQQFVRLEPGQGLHLIVGGYRSKQAAILERRHELMSLAHGWADNPAYLQRLMDAGKQAKKSLRGKLFYVSKGDAKKGFKGVGAPIHETGERLFYARTESILHDFLQDSMTFKEYKVARRRLTECLQTVCQEIFRHVTNPYSQKPELIPIIAVARRLMNNELHNLVEGGQPDANKRTRQKRKKT